MKKNFIFLLSFLFAMTYGLKASAQAQDWFVRAGAGVNYYWGDDDATTKIGHRLSPSFNLTFGKWFNPYWGVQIGGNYGKIKGAGIAVDPKGTNASIYGTADGLSPYTTGEQVAEPIGETGSRGSFYEKFNFVTVQPEIVYNVSNGICGYNPRRVWNVLAHLGPSYGHSWANGYKANSIYVTGGLTSTWKLCRNVQLWADARLSLFNKGFDKVTYRESADCMGTISAGVSFNFGK